MTRLALKHLFWGQLVKIERYDAKNEKKVFIPTLGINCQKSIPLKVRIESSRRDRRTFYTKVLYHMIVGTTVLL